ncbi:MAG: histidine kinase [Gemmatimonadaceae bacterium]|nr:histidine kinase [Gemmatimonadaceae bacterium]
MSTRLRAAALYLALWTPLVLVYIVLIGAANGIPASTAVFEACKTIAVAALCGLPAIWWTKRLGLPGAPLVRFFAAHALGAAAFTLTWNGFILWDLRGQGTWAEAYAQAEPWFGWQLFTGVVIYVLIAGVVIGRIGSAQARARERALREADALRARAELAALRGRLDPHFLFNTLHTVGALVRRDPAAAEAGVERLADLLRYVLDHSGGARDEVPLEDELAFVDAYLALEALRLGDRLRVVREIADDVGDVLVPSLSLQPLVENAIRHGLAPRPQGGTLTLTAARIGEALELVVADDGAGAVPHAAPSGYGLGIDSLRRRLAARHGEAASLAIATAPGAGFRVTLRVPA